MPQTVRLPNISFKVAKREAVTVQSLVAGLVTRAGGSVVAGREAFPQVIEKWLHRRPRVRGGELTRERE